MGKLTFQQTAFKLSAAGLKLVIQSDHILVLKPGVRNHRIDPDSDGFYDSHDIEVAIAKGKR